MIPLILASGLASAADCAPLSDADLRARIGAAKAAVDRDDLVSFAETREDLLAALPCLATPLPVNAWARFLLDDAVVSYALGEGWEATLGTALSLDPTLPRTDLPQALRTWDPPPSSPAAGALASGSYLVDGRSVTAIPALEGLHVVQRREGEALATEGPAGRAVPERLGRRAAPTTPPPGRSRGSPALIATGLAAAVVGTGVGAGRLGRARGGPRSGRRAAADRRERRRVGRGGGGAVLGGVGRHRRELPMTRFVASLGVGGCLLGWQPEPLDTGAPLHPDDPGLRAPDRHRLLRHVRHPDRDRGRVADPGGLVGPRRLRPVRVPGHRAAVARLV